MKKWSVCICNVLNSMENLNIRDTKRKEILPKKKLISIFNENARDPNETSIFPEIKYQRFRLENMFTEYFEAKHRNCNEILWEKKVLDLIWDKNARTRILSEIKLFSFYSKTCTHHSKK